MQTSYVWNKLHLYRQKVGLLLLLGFLCSAASVNAQRRQPEADQGLSSSSLYGQNRGNRSSQHLIEYDRRLLTYGFTLGVHSSTLRLNFSDAFASTQNGYDTVANIVSPNAFGFSIGFLANLRLLQFLDVRVMPKVGFYQYSINHQFVSGYHDTRNFFSDFTTIDLPVMLKYKSQRRQNFRMFYVGGLTPTIDVTGKRQREENEEDGLQLNGDNLSFEVGFGSDIYFPLFRFSPEIRYSYGLVNVLKNQHNDVGMAFRRMTTQSISLYLVFN